MKNKINDIKNNLEMMQKKEERNLSKKKKMEKLYENSLAPLEITV